MSARVISVRGVPKRYRRVFVVDNVTHNEDRGPR
jgi:hypothetical protein